MKKRILFWSLAACAVCFPAVVFPSWTLSDEPLWTLSPGDRPYLATDYSDRGLAHNPATGNVYVVHGPAGLAPVVGIVDGQTGAHVGELSVEGISGGLRALRMIAAAESGVIFGANHTRNPDGADGPFRLYRWSDEAADPVVVFEGDPSDGYGPGDFGRNIAVREIDGEIQLLFIGHFGDGNPQIAALFTSDDGGETVELSAIETPPTQRMELGSAFGPGETFWGSRAGQSLREFGFDGALLREFGSDVIDDRISAISIDPERMLLGAIAGWGRDLVLFDLTTLSTGSPNAPLASRSFPTGNANIEVTGEVVFGDGAVYALDTNNGVIAYEVVEPPPADPNVLWRLLPGDRPYLTTNYAERGLAYNPETGNVYLTHFSDPAGLVLPIIDGLTGEHTGELSTEEISGGFRPLRRIGASGDGIIFGGNQTLDSAADPYRLYRWDDEESDPVLAWEGDPSGGLPGVQRRYGTNIAVRGTAAGAIEVLVVPDYWEQVAEPNAVGLLRSVDGGETFTLMTIETVPTTRFGLGTAFGEGETFWGTRAGQPLREFDFDGNLVREFTGTYLSTGLSAIGVNYETGILAGIASHTVQMYDLDLLAEDRFNAALATQSFATTNENIEATGEIAFGENGIIYALDTNNGVMAFTPQLEVEPVVPGDIYWTNTAHVRTADSDGSDARTVAAGLGRAIGIAIDSEKGYVFWAEDAGGRLRRANLDGTGAVTIAELETVGGASGQFVAVNPDIERVYWAEWTKGLFSANYDGSDVQHLIVRNNNQTSGVAVDRATGQVYLGSVEFGEVWRVESDGSGETSYAWLPSQSYGLAVDPDQNRLYFSNFSQGTLGYYDLATHGTTTLLSNLGQPLGITLSESGDRLYWAERTNGRIRTAEILGTSLGTPETLVSGEDSPFGIALKAPAAIEDFATWIANLGVPEGQRGPEDDPDGDGILNIVEYALGANPLLANRGVLPEPGFEQIGDESYLKLAVQRNPLATGVTLAVEVSSDLIHWDSGPGHTVVLEDTAELLEVRDATPAGEANRRFIRLRVIFDG